MIYYQVKKSVLKKYGNTEACEGCRRKRAGLRHQRHAPECRQRLENAMAADETHQETLKRRDER